MGALVMVGRSLWVSLLVSTGSGGFHALCILTDKIRFGIVVYLLIGERHFFYGIPCVKRLTWGVLYM